MKVLLYIVISLLLFTLLMLLGLLFIRFKILVKGKYWDKKAAADIDAFWIRYFLGVRCRVHDIEHIRFTVWFFGIPLPFTLPLAQREKQKTKRQKTPKGTVPETPAEKNTGGIRDGFFEKIRDLQNIKGELSAYWQRYRSYLKKIFVRYITFSINSLSANIGFAEPSQTGMAAGIAYSIMPNTSLRSVDLQWNYREPNFDLAADTKISMKLYGILCTLICLYRQFKKDQKNEIR